MWVETARDLREQLGWMPRYWVAHREHIREAATAFPEAITHDRAELNRGLPSPKCKHCMNGALSRAELNAAAPHVLMGLCILERGDLGRTYGHQEAAREINRLLIYWIGVLKELGIEVCIFSTPPHSVGEYLLYAACILRNIPCRMLMATGLCNINIVCDSFDELPQNLASNYEEVRLSGRVDLSEALATEIENVLHAERDYRPTYLTKTQERSAHNARVVEALSAEVRHGNLIRQPFQLDDFPHRTEENGGWLKKVPILEPRPKETDGDELVRAYKLPGRSLAESSITKRQFAAYRQWAMVEKIHFQDEYNALSRELDLGQPYLYFALHYQPERTTFPDGGPFGDQFLAIRLIRAHLPEGWSIYVKEHPSQFLYRLNGEMGRWSGYYDDLLIDESVHFVDQSASTIALLDHCKAVGTITGMVGWEGLLRGKAVLCFGNAWYGACRGAFLIREHADAASAFELITAGSVTNESEPLYYATALAQTGATIDISRDKEATQDRSVPSARSRIFVKFERSKLSS